MIDDSDPHAERLSSRLRVRKAMFMATLIAFVGVSAFLLTRSMSTLLATGSSAVALLTAIFYYERIRGNLDGDSRVVLRSLEALQYENSNLRLKLDSLGSASIAERGDTASSIDELAAAARTTLTQSFREYGKSNDRFSYGLFGLAILVLAGSVGAAAWLLSNLPDGEATVGAVITRASVSLPGAILFAVLAREAAARRSHGAWGRLTAIQATALGPYTAGLPDELRHELMMEFGRAVFRGGDVALESGSRRRASDKANSTEHFALLTEVMKAVGATAGATASIAKLGESRSALEAE